MSEKEKPVDQWMREDFAPNRRIAELEAENEALKIAAIKFMAYVARECIVLDDFDEQSANRIRNQIYETRKIVMPP